MKIAVLGSCVTRDIFNSRFNPNYKQYFEVVVTQHQASIVALMGKKMHVDPTLIDNLNAYDTWQIRSEFNKEFFDKMKERRPDYLIIDFFADAYYGFIKVGDDGEYLTCNNSKLFKTSYYKNLTEEQKRPYLIFKNKDEYWKVWTRSIDRLFQFFKKELPECKIILHKVRLTKYYRTKEGEIKQITYRKGLDIDLINKCWDEMDDYVLNKYQVQPIYVLGHFVSYEEHPWGVFGVHFTSDYHHQFLEKLIRMTSRKPSQNRTFIDKIKSLIMGSA